MDKALALSKTINEDNFCVLAQQQQLGQGTQGRIWHSPKGNFYATYGFNKKDYQFEKNGQIALIALIAGIAVAEILTAYNIDIGLKWSNDLIIDDKKTGGILCIIHDNYIMIGIGINFISDDNNKLYQQGFFPSTFIRCYFDISFFDLAQKLGNYLKNNFDIYTQQGFTPFQQAWQNYSAFCNRLITVELPDKSLKTGIDSGIDAQGRLIIHTQKGIEYFHSVRIVKVERNERIMMSL
jgi:biotin-[acetyl-CoA-carboxylase] ligase BirA-like protein